ncbi:MAG: M28 family peptidase, partial [Faecalibacterium sp.]|nr:M28 family peptidase [Faecalibacterium sp.]
QTQSYIKDGIRYVCENYKRRSPGSKSERDSQAFFKSELEKFSDHVIMEDFTLHPAAFMGFIIIAVTLCLVAVALYWFMPFDGSISKAGEFVLAAVPPILILFSILMFLFEFLFYAEFVDFLFPKKVSRNVYAVRKPQGTLKRRIIFGGHADAANEWTYSLHGQMKTLAPVMGGSIIGMFVIFVITLSRFLHSFTLGFVPVISGAWKVLGIIMLIFVPFIFCMYFFINWRVVVDGANDNLSACYIAMGVLKEMADNDFRFENTEVCCLITGSEEAGLRGAKAFAKKHKDELTAVETVVITMDTMREIEQLQIYTQGCTGTVKDSEAVGDLLHDAGLANSIDMKRADVYPGAVDAEGFSKHKIRACGFCGVNHDPKTYYHTRKDTWTNINEECIDLSLDICLEAARLYDKKGGIASYEAARKRVKK